MTSYEIRVKGYLDGRWSKWFDGLTNANLRHGVTVLNKVRNLNLALVSITSINLNQQEPATGPAKHRSDGHREHYILHKGVNDDDTETIGRFVSARTSASCSR